MLLESLLQKDLAIDTASALGPPSQSRELCVVDKTHQAAAAASLKHLSAAQGHSNPFALEPLCRLDHVLPAWETPDAQRLGMHELSCGPAAGHNQASGLTRPCILCQQQAGAVDCCPQTCNCALDRPSCGREPAVELGAEDRSQSVAQS